MALNEQREFIALEQYRARRQVVAARDVSIWGQEFDLDGDYTFDHLDPIIHYYSGFGWIEEFEKNGVKQFWASEPGGYVACLTLAEAEEAQYAAIRELAI